VIIGAGPAGLTAAIYTARSGMSTVILDKANIGGQVAITPVVENYPGYSRIPGKTLTDMMAQQASQYAEIHQGEEVLDFNETKKGLLTIKTASNTYKTKVVIVATGAEHTRLGVPGEERFFGRGVSYCATCDGYFFKDGKKVIMVGGGNTAATEALYLESIGVDVTIVHRRDQLRAEDRLQKNLQERAIPIVLDTVVEEIVGENVVKAVRLRNLKDDTTYEIAVEGVFVAIGYDPVNEIAKKMGLALTDEGYIKVDEGMRTSITGVYAAGDITGGIKQIATAVGQGSVAAINASEDTMNPYWKK
jgi:thioredoxin reductase (NADPH)